MQHHTLYQQTIADLKDCYDTHAEKFSSTRKKHWPEMERISKRVMSYELGVMSGEAVADSPTVQLSNCPTVGLSIVELGCGDGRLYHYLREHGVKIDSYTGVDISDKLLEVARASTKDTKHCKRVTNDMISYLQGCKNESTDIIVCMASFQHLPDKESRAILLQHIYRVLRYGGLFITIDRSWSSWMLRKHWKLLLQSLGKSLLSGGKWEWNNLLIPFQSGKSGKGAKWQSGNPAVLTGQDVEKVAEWQSNKALPNCPTVQLSNCPTVPLPNSLRLYHIFTRPELRGLLTEQGFIMREMIYSSQGGDFHHQRQQARNICTCVSKDVFVKSDSDQ